MRGRTGGRVRLLELILDLCVFAVCAVVCVLLLVRAQGISAGSQRLTRAVYLAQSAARANRRRPSPLPRSSSETCREVKSKY